MDFRKYARYVTLLLLLVQIFVSFGFAVMATVSNIVGADLSGSAALSGLPGALLQTGAAAAAPERRSPWSRGNAVAPPR